MKRVPNYFGVLLLLSLALALAGCGGGASTSSNPPGGNPPPQPSSPKLSVTLAGNGSGSVTSNPSGINCGSTCSANFSSGTAVTLTASPASGSTFGGWSGACSGTSTCSVTMSANHNVTATFTKAASLASINHIIFMAQENRSFDEYFGKLADYWAANGFPAQQFDGIPRNYSNPGCDPLFPPPSHCTVDSNSPTIVPFHLGSVCIQNTTPSWNESHVDFNNGAPASQNPKMDGFVHMAGSFARDQNPMYFDTDGQRAIGYYDGNDLNYYYFMASNFGTSDRWYAPVMSRTQINRMYLIAATSQGHIRPLQDTNSPQLNAKTIFQLLQEHGITWKIYVHPDGRTNCTTTDCLLSMSYINEFKYEGVVRSQFPQNIAPISQYFTDLQNGTLPQVALIEPASNAGLDEHPTETNGPGGVNIQLGAKYVSSLINALMSSSSWSSSVFILTYDEHGGLFDHVPPASAKNPDGIPPMVVFPDVCSSSPTTGTCNFQTTAFRVPLIVISPFSKKNFVDHTPADYTAWLKLVETRFGLPPLTARDAAQPDMTEFFDFTNAPWMTPPTPPKQNTNGRCFLDHLQ